MRFDTELAAWRGLRRTAELLSALIGQDIGQKTGLSSQDFGVLMFLSDAEQEHSLQREIQNFLGWDKSRLSHHLSRMEKRGLIARQRNGRDAIIMLTEEGRRLISMAKPVHFKSVEQYFSAHLSEEDQQHLIRITDILKCQPALTKLK